MAPLNVVLLLRGINVGGKNVVKMEDLRAILASLGGENVSTYIQSGNAVLQIDVPPHQFAKRLAQAISDQMGFAPAVQVMSGQEFSQVVADNPFIAAVDCGKHLHTWFLQQAARRVDENRLIMLAADDEQFELSSKAFYLHAPSGVGRSKLAAGVEKLLAVPSTARNQNTIEQLLKRLRALP